MRNMKRPRQITLEGKTVSAAVESALKKLNITKEDADVQIIEKGTSGFLGLGSKPAIVSVREKRPMSARPRRAASPYSDTREKPFRRNGGGRRDDRRAPKRGGFRGNGRNADSRFPSGPKEFLHEPLDFTIEGDCSNIFPETKLEPLTENRIAIGETACKIVNDLVANMGYEPSNIAAGWDALQERMVVSFCCNESDIFTSREGRALYSIGYLTTLMVAKQTGKQISVQVDTCDYWRNVERKILSDISRAVAYVKKTHRTYRLEHMDSALRRFVHKVLATNDSVKTFSEGEGKWRKIVIQPK